MSVVIFVSRDVNDDCDTNTLGICFGVGCSSVDDMLFVVSVL